MRRGQYEFKLKFDGVPIVEGKGGKFQDVEDAVREAKKKMK